MQRQATPRANRFCIYKAISQDKGYNQVPTLVNSLSNCHALDGIDNLVLN